jgi:hypothetical protein
MYHHGRCAPRASRCALPHIMRYALSFAPVSPPRLPAPRLAQGRRLQRAHNRRAITLPPTTLGGSSGCDRERTKKMLKKFKKC